MVFQYLLYAVRLLFAVWFSRYRVAVGKELLKEWAGLTANQQVQ